MIACPLKKLVILALFCFGFLSHAQVPTEVYAAYDASSGLENLNINNGRGYPNPYLVRKGNHQFLSTDEYSSGSVVYDGQPYFNVALRYDIYHDILIYLPKNGESNIGTILEKRSVSSFVLDGKNFVNLDFLADKPDFVNGYYQKSYEGKNLALFCKQHKMRREKHGERATYEEFDEAPNFVMLVDGVYRKADSRSQVTEIFPDQKDRIRDFYRKDKDLEKTSLIAFMENLARYIDNYTNP